MVAHLLKKQMQRMVFLCRGGITFVIVINSAGGTSLTRFFGLSLHPNTDF